LDDGVAHVTSDYGAICFNNYAVLFAVFYDALLLAKWVQLQPPWLLNFDFNGMGDHGHWHSHLDLVD
jgi:hypothetical protein